MTLCVLLSIWMLVFHSCGGTEIVFITSSPDHATGTGIVATMKCVFQIPKRMLKARTNINFASETHSFESSLFAVTKTTGNSYSVQNKAPLQAGPLHARFNVSCPDTIVPTGNCSDIEEITAPVEVCHPNGSIEVANPNNLFYTQAFAADITNETVYATTWDHSKEWVIIGVGVLNRSIIVHFSDRSTDPDADMIFTDGINIIVFCSDIADEGVNVTHINNLGITVPALEYVSANSTFEVITGIRNLTGSVVSSASLGTQLHLTFDFPEEYSLLPMSCTAYSGTDNTGTTNKEIIANGCSTDDSLIGNFGNTEQMNSSTRSYAVLYVFKFYDSASVFIHCTVKVCPPESSSCLFDCSQSKRKRHIDGSTDSKNVKYFWTRDVIRIYDYHNAGTAITLAPQFSSIAVIVKIFLLLPHL